MQTPGACGFFLMCGKCVSDQDGRYEVTGTHKNSETPPSRSRSHLPPPASVPVRGGKEGEGSVCDTHTRKIEVGNEKK